MALLRWAALAAAALMLVPATALALPLADPAPQALMAPPGLGAAADAHAALLALAGGIGPSVRPGDALLRIGAQSTDATAPALPPLSFQEALAALYATAGLPAPGADAAPPAPLAEALAPVVEATAVAAALTQQAFAALSAEDQAFLWSHFGQDADDSAADQARVEALAAMVDMPRIRLGSALLANALAAFEAPGGMGADNSGYSDPSGFLQVGGTGDDQYCDIAAPILIIELGGNDKYCGHPASFTPWTVSLNGASAAIPVRAILDVHGNDRYAGEFDPATELTWGNAVGIGGIGLIVDRAGEDQYLTSVVNRTTTNQCFQTLYGIAVGGLGVGAIIDASGNDQYDARNVNTAASNCHFGWVYTFAEATALSGGVGAILDYTGDDRYSAYSESSGKADNLAHVYAQGAASGGVAALVDEEGHDGYVADAYAYAGPIGTQIKGDFAYVIAQGATFHTRYAPSALPPLNVPGLGNQCFVVPLGVYTLVLCVLGGREGSNDAAPTLAVLADLVGRDTFRATPRAWDLDRGCTYVWAVSSAQGSAAIPGSVAALLNLDVSDVDVFNASPRADGKCGAGVRAFSYGQGFGGAVQWPFYEWPYPADGLAVGLLVSAGPVRATCPQLSAGELPGLPPIPLAGQSGGASTEGGAGSLLADVQQLLNDALGGRTIELPDPSGIQLPSPQPIEVPGLPACRGDALPGGNVLNSPDSYSSQPVAVNNGCWGGCVAQAESWVQGSAARETTAYVTYRVLGVGLNVDVGGDDSYLSEPCAWSATPAAASSLSVAQGASISGVGALVNVGGVDIYNARACGHGTKRIVAQGIGDGTIGTPAQTVTPGGAPIVTPPVNVGGVPVLGPQQVFPPSISVGGATVSTPAITIGGTTVPSQQLSVPGYTYSPAPVNTPPVGVGGVNLLPPQTVDPFRSLGIPATQTIPSVGIIIDLSGTNDWYSQASGTGPLVGCYGASGTGPNGQTLGSLFALVTDAHIWSDDVPIIPTTCPAPSSGWGFGMDWASDLGI